MREEDAAPRATNLILLLGSFNNSIPLLSSSNAQHCCFWRQTRKERRKTRRRHRSTVRPTMQTTFTVPTHYVARLSSSSADEDGDGGGIDCRCCCKTVKTTNCGLERVRGRGRRRLRVPFPSAVKYIQEAFECVCCVESREGRGGQTHCVLYWKGNKEVKQEGEILLHLQFLHSSAGQRG